MLAFGLFRLCPTSLTLHRGTARVRLGSRALRILLALIERRGEVVGTQDLMTMVWPNTVVEETNLRVNIFALRKALADGGGANYIQNVSGRGYRFAARVEETSEAELSLGGAWPAESLVGQEAFVERAAATLNRDRLVTLVGPPGIGKTTIAQALGVAWSAQHDSQPVFVDLSAVTLPSMVLPVVAAALGMPAALDDVVRALAQHVADDATLLILDNCEHVVDEAAALATLITDTSKKIFILSTSREALRFRGERVLHVPPLAFPESALTTADAADAFSAIRLFVRAAQSVDDQFGLNDENAAAIANICRRLEGIPLAIELAAAQANVLGVEAIAIELSQRFDLLSRGIRGPVRHRTLDEALRWSYDLLTPVQKTGLKAFAVFAGSFDLGAAQAMTGHLGLSADTTLGVICDLVDKSLLTVEGDSLTHRYRLMETVRAYAARQSAEDGEWDALRAIHARYLVDELRALFAEFSLETIKEAGSLASDIDQTLDWAFGASGQVELGVTLTAVAAPFWMKLSVNDQQDHLFAARAAITSGAARLDNPAEEIFLEFGLASSLYSNRGVCPELEDAFRRASDLSRATGDMTGEIKGCRLAYAMFGNDGAYEAELDAAKRYRELTVGNENSFTEFVYYRMMARGLHDVGRHVEARSFSQRALAPAPVTSTLLPHYDDAIGLWCVSKGTLARIMWVLGFPDQAREMADESLAEGLVTDHPTLPSWTLAYNVCPIDFWRGETDRAAEHIALLRTQSQSIVEHRSGWAMLYSDILQAITENRTVMVDRSRLRTRRSQADIFATLPVALPREFILALDTKGDSWALPEVLRRQAEQHLADHGLEGSDVAEVMLLRARDIAVAQGALSWELRNALALWRLRSLQGRPGDALRDLEEVYGRFSEGFATPDLVAARTVLNGVKDTVA